MAENASKESSPPSKVDDNPENIFKTGTVFWKVRTFNKWYRRRYFLNFEKQQIVYEGSHKIGCGTANMMKIDIADIDDVRKGFQSDIFNKVRDHVAKQKSRHPEKSSLVNEDHCLSIVYGHPLQTLNLMATKVEVRDLWAKALISLMAKHKNASYEQKKGEFLRRSFHSADKDKSNSLSFNECLKLLKNQNIKLPSKKFAKELYDRAKVHKGVGGLNQDEYIVFHESISERKDLKIIMQKFGIGGEAIMGAEELSKFLIEEQKMKISDCQSIIDHYEVETDNEVQPKLLTLTGFTKFLMSESHQQLFNSEHFNVYQDMTKPMSHYFIASSHNTYLVGNQLAGNSSIDGYISALKKGCRCVELDLWDGDDGEPIIYHGHTFTSKLTLKDVLTDAILPFAFTASQYPLFLSLENHCSVEQQERVAQLMKSILGDMLYTCSQNALEELQELPSPENLKGKIVIKGKKLSEDDDLDEASESEPEDPNDPEEAESGKQKTKPKSPTLSKDFSDLVSVCRSVHFKGFDESRKRDKCYDIASISEKKALSLIDKNASVFVEHTKRNLVRIYPKGTRTGSSNYKPIPMWNVGAQIVALNYQTGDNPNLINAAKFATNGNCGYVLKPKFMLQGAFDPNSFGNEYKKILKLRVISGQCLPKPESDKKGEIVDPYVVVKIHGHPDDKQKFQTKVVDNNGFNPIWDDGVGEDKTFEVSLKLPEASFLHFIVYDSDQGIDDKLGQSVIPFISIQQGYRHVNLVSKYGDTIDGASLFIHVMISDSANVDQRRRPKVSGPT